VLSPVLRVATAANDLTLLTSAELRTAVGVTDGSKDVDLARLGRRVADAITQACKVATDGATPATLRKESLTDTFRLNRWWGRSEHQGDRTVLYLSRRPIVAITSVVEAGTTLVAADYEVRAGSGGLMRLFNGNPMEWARGLVVVSYDAGWDTVPEGLKRAAEKLMRLYWFKDGRDPNVRQINIPGVMEVQRWIGASNDPSISQDVMDDLGPYINPLT
jgi:hypothetical protein